MTGLFGDEVQRGATLSACRRYRYALWRTWHPAWVPLVVIGLNPSTADEETNDPTIERCERRARQLGLGGLVMLNLFAWRSTDPSLLPKDRSAIQEPNTNANDEALLEHTRTGLVVCAWGNGGEMQGRGWAVRLFLRREGRELYALKVTASGHPSHPLYLPYTLKPELLA